MNSLGNYFHWLMTWIFEYCFDCFCRWLHENSCLQINEQYTIEFAIYYLNISKVKTRLIIIIIITPFDTFRRLLHLICVHKSTRLFLLLTLQSIEFATVYSGLPLILFYPNETVQTLIIIIFERIDGMTLYWVENNYPGKF